MSCNKGDTIDPSICFDDWWENSGIGMARDDIYRIARAAFMCGFNTKRGEACDGKYERSGFDGRKGQEGDNGKS